MATTKALDQNTVAALLALLEAAIMPNESLQQPGCWLRRSALSPRSMVIFLFSSSAPHHS